MVNKNLFSFVFCIVMFNFLIGTVFAFSCGYVSDIADCDGGAIMGLSSDSNAHGSLADTENAYTNFICCDFDGTNSCRSNTNHVLDLSSDSNAHAEIDGTNGYSSEVCFGELDCRDGNQISCTSDEFEIVSLSDTTNAHLGTFDAYPEKVCCKWENYEASWVDPIDSEKIKTSAYIDDLVGILLTHSGLNIGDYNKVKIFENDFLNGDDNILPRGGNNVLGNVVLIGGINAILSGIWDISQNDYNEAKDIVGGIVFDSTPNEFYFEANGVQSDFLNVLPSNEGAYLCRAFETQLECDATISNCRQAVNSMDELSIFENGVGCGDYLLDNDGSETDTLVNCFCQWVDDSCQGSISYLSSNLGVCGNGITEPSNDEECDDDNEIDWDGCFNNCTYGPCFITSTGMCDGGCLPGLTLCSDGTCSVLCEKTDKGVAGCKDLPNNNCEDGEGCACSDCNGEKDTCDDNNVCVLNGTVTNCCTEDEYNGVGDGVCNQECYFVDVDCSSPTPTHTECNNNMCVEISGDGINECSPLGGSCTIPPINHAECVSNSCVMVSGSGTNECDESVDCSSPTPTHTECNNNMCVEISGDGINECSPLGGSCTIPPINHAECVSNSCVMVSGSGTNECDESVDCSSPTPTHTECNNNMCVEISGDGINECSPLGGSCTIPPINHAECVSNSCVMVSGSGTNECDESVDCSNLHPVCGNGIPEYHEECDDGNTNNYDGCSSICKIVDIPSEDGSCPDGLSLCKSGKCSLNCYLYGGGIACDYDEICESGEGCSCRDCDKEEKNIEGEYLCLEDDSVCSLLDLACCNTKSDGKIDPSCYYADPDNWVNLNYPKIGYCNYISDNQDDCEDGFLEYSWEGKWVWGKNSFITPYNSFSKNSVDYIFADGKYHYDPLRISETSCESGEKTLACPAQIKLPFFGFFGFLISLILISLIYLSLIFKNKKILYLK